MRFSTTFAILAAVGSSVDAWTVRFYESSACSPSPGKNMRGLSSGKQGDCFTFGADMPGVSCSEVSVSNQGKVSSTGCSSSGWRPHSATIEGGRGCTLFHHPNCEGFRWDTGPLISCQNRRSNGDDTIRSLRC
ncbi:hypothetical protein ACHAQH_010023, partial [Verticillium albo-atrum]